MPAYNQSILSRPMPERIKRLWISPTGYPVPWFVTWFNGGQPCDPGEGVPDFRVADQGKMMRAIKQHLCWTCGEPLGQFKAFVIGPMCCVNRVIAEPPSHRDCAIYSARGGCPFLSQPRMKRNEKDLPDQCVEAAGLGLKRNPGAVCVWMTRTFKTFRPNAGNAGVLFSIGNPVAVLWFAQGRAATRDEVMGSIDSGLPTLMELAEQEGPVAVAALKVQVERAMVLVPA